MNGGGATVHARGCMRVVHGASLLSRGVGRLLRLPRATPAADMRLTITRAGGVEQWMRTFDGVRLFSEQRETAPGVIAERFGTIEFHFRAERENGATRYRQVGALLRLGPVRIALPGRLAPRVEGLEHQTGPDSFNVHVRVTWPPSGLILEYDGDVHIEDRFA